MPPLGYRSFARWLEHAIQKSHYEAINAKELVIIMAVSERTLNRRIRELTGKTPKSFIDGVRMNHACTLLSTSKKSIKDVAFSLGYSDESVFRRLFKRKMNMTPSSYQERQSQCL